MRQLAVMPKACAWCQKQATRSRRQEAGEHRIQAARGGGQAQLTPFGRKVIDLYRAMQSQTEARFCDDIAALEAALEAGQT
jgi:molybdenum-dependent DNA-binding transcriptional regulator ModE